MSTYKEILQAAQKTLRQQEIADADLDAWYLMSHVFGISRTELLLYGDKSVPEERIPSYMELIGQRANHIPLQYITGTQEFMGLEFEVTPQVLIPRQDTELLVEEVLRVSEGKSVLDMCTGSGCIIVSIAKLGAPRSAIGVDISDKALEVASKNANKLEAQVEFIQSNLFDGIEGTYDIIVSNPPYIPTGDIEELMPEVKQHEPLIALDGREDGLFFYRKIVEGLHQHLSAEGMVFFEIGYDQAEDVKQILLKEGFADVNIKKDLSGLNRVVTARRA